MEQDAMIRIAIAPIAVLIFALTTAQAAQVTFYQLPQGAFPHDVAPAPDGKVWYSGQRLGVLGVFDPATGKAEHVPLGKGSAPHGVIAGPDGAAWLTDSGQNAIVRFDPATRAIKLFPLPKDAANANLNTAAFDRNGVLWFTGQSGFYGRVDPKSGKVEAWKAPKGRGPYGIGATPLGDVWYASLAGDHIARIDIASGAVSVIDPPRKGVGPRRVWSDSKGVLWVSFWHTGEVGRYDPAAKSWKTWALPNSKSGAYSVYVDDKDKVWLTDFVANAIVRFDPVTEKFESFPSDKRGAAVRQMLGRPGEAWGGESGTDRLVVVRD
jgi:virginiamycin B lyase